MLQQNKKRHDLRNQTRGVNRKRMEAVRKSLGLDDSFITSSRMPDLSTTSICVLSTTKTATESPTSRDTGSEIKRAAKYIASHFRDEIARQSVDCCQTQSLVEQNVS